MKKILLILDGTKSTTYAVACTVDEKLEKKFVIKEYFNYFSESKINWVITNYNNDSEDQAEFKKDIKKRFKKTYQIFIVDKDKTKEKNQKNSDNSANKNNLEKIVDQIKSSFV